MRFRFSLYVWKFPSILESILDRDEALRLSSRDTMNFVNLLTFATALCYRPAITDCFTEYNLLYRFWHINRIYDG